MVERLQSGRPSYRLGTCGARGRILPAGAGVRGGQIHDRAKFRANNRCVMAVLRIRYSKVGWNRTRGRRSKPCGKPTTSFTYALAIHANATGQGLIAQREFLKAGLVAPASSQDGSVRSDLHVVAEGSQQLRCPRGRARSAERRPPLSPTSSRPRSGPAHPRPRRCSCTASASAAARRSVTLRSVCGKQTQRCPRNPPPADTEVQWNPLASRAPRTLPDPHRRVSRSPGSRFLLFQAIRRAVVISLGYPYWALIIRHPKVTSALSPPRSASPGPARRRPRPAFPG
jgi:hypothetical protein